MAGNEIYKLIIYALLVGVIFVVFSKIDPFGIKTAADIQSESIFMQLVGGPWYQSKAQEKITVVLIDDQYLEKTKDSWPMPYVHQAHFLMDILDFNPKAIYLDIIYRHDHENEDDDIDQLVNVIQS